MKMMMMISLRMKKTYRTRFKMKKTINILIKKN